MTVYAIYYRHYVRHRTPFETEEEARDHIRWGEEEGLMYGIGIYNEETNTFQVASIPGDGINNYEQLIKDEIGREDMIHGGHFNKYDL